MDRGSTSAPKSEKTLPAQAPLSRRTFFKAGILGATLGVSTLASNRKAVAAEAAKQVNVKVQDEFPNEISPSYKRFHEGNTMFNLGYSGKNMVAREAAEKQYSAGVALEVGDAGEFKREKGFTQLEYALSDAGWSVDMAMGSGYASMAYSFDGPTAALKYKFKDKKDASTKIKRACKSLGADLVGIAPYDERWTYASFFDSDKLQAFPAELPFTPKSVIVMAVEMDYDQMGTSPSWVSDATTGLGYSRMAALGLSVAQFMRNLGYKSFGSGNEVALSVPYGVAAGLGEASRMSILVTYEYGPRVRLCKVFTELEVEYDKPKTFGVEEFCKHCMRCADSCPAKAIPKEIEPSFPKENVYTSSGVKKWAIDAEKCFKYWGESRTSCSTCVTACVYNKPDFWHHKMVYAMTKAAPGPLHSFMREMDILFGYGNTFDKKALAEWWDKA